MNKEKLLRAYDLAQSLYDYDGVVELKEILRELVLGEMTGGGLTITPNTNWPDKHPTIPTCEPYKPTVTWTDTTAGSVNEGGAR